MSSPLTSDLHKGRTCRSQGLLFALCHRVGARRQQFPCGLMGFARFGQGHIRVHAQGHDLLLALEAILPAPVLAGLIDQQVETPAVGKLAGLVGKLFLLDLQVSQRRAGVSSVEGR